MTQPLWRRLLAQAFLLVGGIELFPRLPLHLSAACSDASVARLSVAVVLIFIGGFCLVFEALDLLKGRRPYA